jgi:cyclopropane-fatty-acyl-phospholipid synthase
MEAVFPLLDYLSHHGRLIDRLRLFASVRRSQFARAAVPPFYGSNPQMVYAGARSSPSEKVSFHYDRPLEFWQAWLDPYLQYTCAYFQRGHEKIEQAQTFKMDNIYRKLNLRRGELLVDLGCGWGGFLVRAVALHGVTGVGLTLSLEQARHARSLAESMALGGRCEFRVADFSTCGPRGGVDKMSAVGVFEHVGTHRMREFFAVANGALKPGGLLLVQSIASTALSPTYRGLRFIDRYVFPGGALVRVSAMQEMAEAAGFEVRDVECIREHYVLTLRQWVSRIEERRAEVCAAAGEECYRAFLAYMAGSAYAFERNRISVYQILLRKPGPSRSVLPLSRGEWMAEATAAS